MYVLTASLPFLARHLPFRILLYTHALTFRYSIFFHVCFLTVHIQDTLTATSFCFLDADIFAEPSRPW